jgi:quercetin dioxygenase-like cupin family protein
MEVQRKSPTIRGPAEWFTGDVWIDAVAQDHGPSPMSIGSVHFAPGARTAWHSHSIGQTLHVTEGEGRVQSRGEPSSPSALATSSISPGASGTGTARRPTTS